MTTRWVLLLPLVMFMTVLAATGTLAVLIDTGDGSGNLEAPPNLAGWANVGSRLGGTSVIYMGNGWVLTARHVGAGVVLIEDERYDPIPDSQVLFGEDDDRADLLAFRIRGNPELPELPMLQIARASPVPGDEVVMIGNGRDRGAHVEAADADGSEIEGWHWGKETNKRWGTNRVITIPPIVRHADTQTQTIATRFDNLYAGQATEFEAQAALGDSGGGVFVRRDRFDPESPFELAAVMFTIAHANGGPAETALYGDLTFSVDLPYYREKLIQTIRPACFDERDNDGDGRFDYPADTGCSNPSGDDEGGDEDEQVREKRRGLVQRIGGAGALIVLVGIVVLVIRASRRRR